MNPLHQVCRLVYAFKAAILSHGTPLMVQHAGVRRLPYGNGSCGRLDDQAQQAKLPAASLVPGGLLAGLRLGGCRLPPGAGRRPTRCRPRQPRRLHCWCAPQLPHNHGQNEFLSLLHNLQARSTECHLTQGIQPLLKHWTPVAGDCRQWRGDQHVRIRSMGFRLQAGVTTWPTW